MQDPYCRPRRTISGQDCRLRHGELVIGLDANHRCACPSREPPHRDPDRFAVWLRPDPHREVHTVQVGASELEDRHVRLVANHCPGIRTRRGEERVLDRHRHPRDELQEDRLCSGVITWMLPEMTPHRHHQRTLGDRGARLSPPCGRLPCLHPPDGRRVACGQRQGDYPLPNSRGGPWFGRAPEFG